MPDHTRGDASHKGAQAEQQIPVSTDETMPVEATDAETDASMLAQSQEIDEASQADSTEPLGGSPGADGQRPTIPLSDSDSPPVPPLMEKSMVGGRYRIDTMLGVLHGTNLYRVTDMQGYRVCWACGSSASMQGDTYCVECGAQLTGRFYRLQEFNAPGGGRREAGGGNQEYASEPDSETEDSPSPTPGSPEAAVPLPAVILENGVAGVARVFDTLVEPGKERTYVVWEEVYGRTLGSWLAGDLGMLSSPTSGHLMELDNPEEEQVLGWMAQAADILAELHAVGISGCDIMAENLVVQPGDRLVLVDPSTCSDMGKPTPAQQLSDIRRLAAELEGWYIAMREDPGMSDISSRGEEDAVATLDDETESTQPQKMISAGDATEPLGSAANPVILLAKAREGLYPTAQEFAEALYEVYEESRPISNIQLWTGRGSDLGLVRQINEDSLLTIEAIIYEHEGGISTGLYVIADGMGGHQSGEVASSIAVRTIGSIVNGVLLGPLSSGDPVGVDLETCVNALEQAVMEANRRIADLARERHSDLGTTVTVAMIIGNQLCVANVGDSRTYLWREGQLAAITRDHSLVAQLVSSGQIAPEDIYTHPRRNEIYRALGDPRLTVDEVDIFTRRLQPGDMVLLCSDGLWDFVRDPDINSILSESDQNDPQAVCQALIDRANKGGGEDNISAILIRVLAPQ
jgi:serine/threonine protein phosphatase PrpC